MSSLKRWPPIIKILRSFCGKSFDFSPNVISYAWYFLGDGDAERFSFKTFLNQSVIKRVPYLS